MFFYLLTLIENSCMTGYQKWYVFAYIALLILLLAICTMLLAVVTVKYLRFVRKVKNLDAIKK
jgi:uncharacterized membrane protein YhdT